MGKLALGAGALVLVLLSYLLFWPVPIAPEAWDAPPNPGYEGDFAANSRLSELELIDLPSGEYGPEDVAQGPDGRLFMAVHSGKILALDLATRSFETFADTGGRPLGVEFDGAGTLWVADAYRGLLTVSPAGEVAVIASETSDGSPILYADDLDIAADGKVYFSDASTRFSAAGIGDTLEASILDLMEHSANGRVLVYDPESGAVDTLVDGLTFANGIALSADETRLIIAETGTYRIHAFDLEAASLQPFAGPLPGFPDNVNDNPDGTYWAGLVSPRNDAIDGLSGAPFLRKVVMRLPSAFSPAPTRYGFIMRLDARGRVLETLQDPDGVFASTTGAITLPDGHIIVSSLTDPRIGILAP
ncbi:MAG: SMP-30/gluconolactonase/LRE family protein [Pseudomonadota bacterium]